MKRHMTEAGIQSETSVPVVVNSFVNYDSRHTALFLLKWTWKRCPSLKKVS